MMTIRRPGIRSGALLPVGILAAAVLLIPACESSTELPRLEALGGVGGIVWLDRNGNGEFDGDDTTVEDVRVVLERSGGVEVAAATSGEEGEFVIGDVPVGDYTAVVDPASLGDSVEVAVLPESPVRVLVADTLLVEVGLAYPAMSVEAARDAPAGMRVFLRGQVLNPRGTFSDSTVHLRDGSGAIRIVQTGPTAVALGDSVRVLGTTATRNGQPVLSGGVFFRLVTENEPPAAVDVSTGQAAAALDGLGDAELVRIQGAVIEDTTRVGDEFTMIVNDGSGELRVLLDDDLPFQPADEVIDAGIDATGLLVPDGESGWLLKPRGPADLSIG